MTTMARVGAEMNPRLIVFSLQFKV